MEAYHLGIFKEPNENWEVSIVNNLNYIQAVEK